MSTVQKRWLCSECAREWLEPTACFANSSPITITGNPVNGVNCIYCGSPEIQLVEYKPELPGLDIPRDGQNKIIPIQVHEMIGREAIKSEGNPNLLGRDAKDLIIPSLVKEEYNPVYDNSDMD